MKTRVGKYKENLIIADENITISLSSSQTYSLSSPIKQRKEFITLASLLLSKDKQDICDIADRERIQFCNYLILATDNFRFMPDVALELPDDMLGVFIVYFVINIQAKKYGVQPNISLETVKHAVSIYNKMDLDYSCDAIITEKVIKKVVNGQASKGGAVYRRHIKELAETTEIKQEAETHSKFNSTIAKKPRKIPNTPFQQLIFDLVTQDPNINENTLNIRLRKHGVVFNADGDTATYQGKTVTYRGKPLKISLKDLLYRAKKKITK